GFVSIRCVSRKVFRQYLTARMTSGSSLNPLHVADGLQIRKAAKSPRKVKSQSAASRGWSADGWHGCRRRLPVSIRRMSRMVCTYAQRAHRRWKVSIRCRSRMVCRHQATTADAEASVSIRCRSRNDCRQVRSQYPGNGESQSDAPREWSADIVGLVKWLMGKSLDP